MSPYRLHYAPDNASLIIRLALEELAHPYDTVLVDRSAEAQRGADYLALNPAGRIPTLETPDGPISETAAILLWLSDRHGRLAPDRSAPERAAFLNWLFFISNTLHADAIQLFYVQRYGPEAAWPQMRQAACARLARHLALLDGEASKRLPDWFCASRVSALDLYVAAILRWLQIYPSDLSGWMDLAAYPTLHHMCAQLETRASVTALRQAEGLEPHPFTQASPPNPPEGSAL